MQKLSLPTPFTKCGAVRHSAPARSYEGVPTASSYIELDIIEAMRPVRFLGNSLKCLRDFPEDARHDAGYQPDKVQRGDQPDDFKPMPAIGKGVEEIRVSESSGAYRVVYLARRADAVYVLHAFHKKTQTTPKKDLEIAKKRFGELSGGGL
jgi:phage-related protein